LIPQYTVIFGQVGGGLAILPSLSDFSFMEKEEARLFLTAPDGVEGNKDEAFAKNFAKDGFRSIHAHCYYPSGFNPTKYKGVINLDPENENCVNYFINDNSKLNKVICIEEQ